MASAAHPSQSSLREVEDQMSNIDHESALLIAELQLQDALAMSANSKGKARADAPASDQEIALQLQTEELSGWKQTHQDAAMAEGIDHALELDAEIIEEYRLMEETAAADRRLAQLLHQVPNVPEPSTAGKTVEGNSSLNPFIEMLIQLSAPKLAAFGWQLGCVQQAPINKIIHTVAQPIAGPSVDRFRSVPCVSCTDSFRMCDMLRGECGDYWCSDCLASAMKVYLRDEALHPLRCCQKAFTTSDLSKIVKDQAIFAQFDTKRREYEVPARDRVYCWRPTCSAFLGSANTYQYRWPLFSPQLPGTATCRGCQVATCVACRREDHPGDTCAQNIEVKQVRALARQEGWQTCPGCSAIVKLEHGCNHVTCRCRTQFCYACGVEWKNCACPQWNERHLITA
ncbi:IBR domain-containing protein [Coprinopsis sp. MPI-PUGE-AT-0042]|nr:IBR domain-containing protein [Coprinopsis sp. MPI-PUGE-AT-0042]